MQSLSLIIFSLEKVRMVTGCHDASEHHGYAPWHREHAFNPHLAVLS
jgi:hypothetical protein